MNAFPSPPETFGTLFRKLRLRAGISTLKEFGDLLSKKGYSYEDSLFSHWQKDAKIPKKREIILAVLKVIKEKNSNLTIEESNAFLTQAGQGYLTDYECVELNISSSSPFLVPPRVSYFTGREKELIEISTELSSNKVVQIVGQAGMGKTTLAIEYAHKYSFLFPDGVLWYRVDTTDMSFILNHIAKMYGENIDDIKDLQLKNAFISSLLKNKKILIVLDNIDIINSKNFHFLLTTGEKVKYLLTTQSTYIKIDPLPALVKLVSFSDEDLQNLYTKIVSSNDTKRFILLCKNYGDLPLVAANLARRINYLKKNNFPIIFDANENDSDFYTYDDKNLYNFFDKIKKILSPDEFRLWVSCATFNALDFSKESVQFINGFSSQETENILEKLYSLSLIEKSTNKKWRVHPSIKNYLSSYLDKNNYINLISYYSFLKRDENGFKKLYPKVENDYDEIRSLLCYCIENDLLIEAMQIWDFFSIYLWDRGYWEVQKNFGEKLLNLAYKQNSLYIAAKIVIRDLAWLYIWQAEFLKTYKLLSNSELQNVIKNDMFLLGIMHQQIGFIFSHYKLKDKSLKHLELAKNIFEKRSDKHHYGKTLLYIGHAYENTGGFLKALQSYKNALAIACKYEFAETESKAYYYIGEIYRKQGNFEDAKKYFNIALDINNTVKRRAGIGWSKHSLSDIAQAEGKIELARRLHRESHEAFALVGVNPALH